MHAEVIASIQGGYVMLGLAFSKRRSSLYVGGKKRGYLKKPCVSGGGTTWADASGDSSGLSAPASLMGTHVI